MRVSAHAEKSHSSVLGITVTRGAGEEKIPGRGVESGVAGAIKEGPERCFTT
jgi:hypothetical protein